MNLQQLHYTSAAPRSDGPGFRFTAASPELPITLLGEAEQLIGYEPPRGAPARPTPEEIAALPVSFSHIRLSDGSRLLCRTVCTGYEPAPGGRRAAFHAHAVRLPDGAGLPGGLLPIEAWESPTWSERAPKSGTPEPISTIVPARRIDKTGLLDFVHSRADRLEAFLADVRTLFRTRDAPQLLVIERDSAHTAYWIAVASAVLPRELADRLTFTTYTRRPLLARQQIVGACPGAEVDFATAAADNRFRVHDCTGGPSSPVRPERDLWAAVATRVWLAGMPALFAEASRDRSTAARDGSDDAGRLAALAAREGIALDANGRTAAARWAREQSPDGRFDATARDRLLTTLAAGGTDRTPEEWTALAAFADELAALAPRVATAPLRRDLRAEMDRLAAAPDQPLVRFLSLLRLAEALRVNHAPLLPPLTERLAGALLDEAAQDRKLVRAALDAHPLLAGPVLGSLDRTAAQDDPRTVARLLTAELPGADLTGCPHLTMATAVTGSAVPLPETDADRPALLHALLKAAGGEYQGVPSVLRTAYRLAWDGRPLRSAEARTLLAELPAAWHREAGLDKAFLHSALTSAPDDPCAPDLARALLASGAEPAPRERAALLLLKTAGELAEGEALPGFTARTATLRAQAAPLEPGIDERVGDALARRLLTLDPPPGELPDLIDSGDEHLLGAYAREARGETVGERLRGNPLYAAVCFVAWHTEPGAGALWDEIRTELLASVLRPEVRRMPAEEIEEMLHCLRQVGAEWVEAFQEWNRLGVLGRLTGLSAFGGRRRSR
ncbi:GTPase-associated protein 1-related protein [Streptomyces sp. NPDC049577]|uniref:GTPase-associated protein 1-related protein n=1 Tax=Streptomyces sp. NPDC049577 TaxID=3155153 RepID=UPI00342CC296